MLEGDEPVGYSQLDNAEIKDNVAPPVAGSGLHLHRLYVLASHQRRGLGRALFEGAIRMAKVLDRQFMWLCAWDENPDAIDFYSHLGMERFGEHAFTIGDHEYRDFLFFLDLR